MLGLPSQQLRKHWSCSLLLRAGTQPGNVARAQLDLVAAQLALRDLDGASVHAQSVLQLPSECRTAGIIRKIAKIDQTLAGEAFDEVTLLSDLREQIAVFSAYPAARDLPQLTTP